MTEAPENWQLAIPFRSLVADTIGQVVAESGFTSQSDQENRVRYVRGDVFIDVAHHPRDGEVSVDFGRMSRDERLPFLLYLRHYASREPAASLDGVSWTATEVRATLLAFAEALRRSGAAILAGDPAMFDAMTTTYWWSSQN